MNADKSLINFNTNQAEKVKKTGKPRILVAPLDWGLGHTTRCIPIINELLRGGSEVIIAGTAAQKKIFVSEFPDIIYLPLQGYNIRYPAARAGFLGYILFQMPKILKTIKNETKWLALAQKEYDFDAVISDNRYGLHSGSIPCIFITHQLTVKSPLGKWNERMLQKWNYKYINRFSECWVPDTEGNVNLAGDLSHPVQKPAIPVRYIGPLSRFERKGNSEKKDHLLVVLSGPEPQRSILEDMLIDELVHYNGTADIIRGLPEKDKLIPSTNQIRFYNHLPAAELNDKIAEAEFVISRCGYSTVMDLVRLQKKSILIPTPGQTEQEYLSRYLFQSKMAYTVGQEQFLLQKDLPTARNFFYRFPEINNNNNSLKEVIDRLLQRLRN